VTRSLGGVARYFCGELMIVSCGVLPVRLLQTAIAGFKRPRAKTSQELINNVQIATPCMVGWDTMSGDDKVRFCGMCEKNVYDISALTADAAVELIREKKGNVCIQLYRRNDGTVLTEDCPRGLKRLRQAMAKKVACAAAAVGWLGFAAGVANAQSPAVEKKSGTSCPTKVTRGKYLRGDFAAPPANSETVPIGGAIAPESVQNIMRDPQKSDVKEVETRSPEMVMLMRLLAGTVAVGASLLAYKRLKRRSIWVLGSLVVVLCAVLGFVWVM